MDGTFRLLSQSTHDLHKRKVVLWKLALLLGCLQKVNSAQIAYAQTSAFRPDAEVLESRCYRARSTFVLPKTGPHVLGEIPELILFPRPSVHETREHLKVYRKSLSSPYTELAVQHEPFHGIAKMLGVLPVPT